MIKDNIYIYTFYRFKNFIGINSIKINLDKYLKNKLILGTVLLANEGINGTISGTKKDLNEFIYFIKQALKIRKLSIKISQNKFIPFYRLKIRLKKEIVTIKIENTILFMTGLNLFSYFFPLWLNTLYVE